MVTETSDQHLLPRSSSRPPPQHSIQSFLGSFITLISNYNIRYEGVLYHLNIQESTLGLRNVICYGTEGRRNHYNEFHVPPIVYEYIIFSGTAVKEIIVSTKPPLALTVKKRIQLISNGTIIKKQATTCSNAFSVMGSVNDGFHKIATQFPGSNVYNDRVFTYIPYDALNQDDIKVSSNLLDSSASEMKYGATHSFFATFPPGPISMPQMCLGEEFEAVTKNFMQYKLWHPTKNMEEETPKPAYNIYRSFDPIPCNPYGPIARPKKQTEICFTPIFL